ncbi:MAG TPA: hypothetical protein VGL26_03460 [Jatrophihabitans sp.]|jgi:hypothetical protein
MSRTARTIASKLRARRASRQFDDVLRSASPSMRQELLALASVDTRTSIR